jgi:hypothetical protein
VFRRVVSLFLLPGLLLSQAAAVGHAHGEDTPTDHSARPHVHTLPAAADRHHTRGHHHGPGGHHHHDDDEDETAPTPAVPPPQADPLSDHDAGAVFVPADAVVVERPASVEVVDAAVMWIICDAGEAVRGLPAVFMCPAGNGRPPPDPSCPLYVRHLALLM